jgi:AcrR family transcriptional regulator
MPRAGLSRAVVVAEAARLADEVGLDRLTMAALAERLGVRLPSLYKHVDGLAAVRRDIALLAIGELTSRLGRAAVGRAGGDALPAMAAAYRDYARAHPGRYAATLRAPGAEDIELAAASEDLLRIVFDVLAGYRLAGADAIDATRALRSALHGFVALEAAGGFGLPQDVDRSFDRMVAGLDVAFGEWAAEHGPDGTAPRPDGADPRSTATSTGGKVPL